MQVPVTVAACRGSCKRSARKRCSSGRSENGLFESGHGKLLQVKSEPQDQLHNTRFTIETQRYRFVIIQLNYAGECRRPTMIKRAAVQTPGSTRHMLEIS